MIYVLLKPLELMCYYLSNLFTALATKLFWGRVDYVARKKMREKDKLRIKNKITDVSRAAKIRIPSSSKKKSVGRRK